MAEALDYLECNGVQRLNRELGAMRLPASQPWKWPALLLRNQQQSADFGRLQGVGGGGGDIWGGSMGSS